MFDGLLIASVIGTCVQAVKDACQPKIPAEFWANKNLYDKDVADGVPIEERMKNLENGRYRLTDVHPEPHKGSNGKIVIENYLLYTKDLEQYGAVQTMEWAKQGRYNLNSKEMKKERKRLDDYYKSLCDI